MWVRVTELDSDDADWCRSVTRSDVLHEVLCAYLQVAVFTDLGKSAERRYCQNNFLLWGEFSGIHYFLISIPTYVTTHVCYVHTTGETLQTEVATNVLSVLRGTSELLVIIMKEGYSR